MAWDASQPFAFAPPSTGGKSRFRRSDPLFNKPTTKGRFFIIPEFIGYSGRIDTGEIQSVAWMTPEEARRDLARRGPGQLGALTIVLQQPSENLVGDSDDLQRLAQIVTGHRQ
jgi:hypothetical protein